jgi:hypothetical protein
VSSATRETTDPVPTLKAFWHMEGTSVLEREQKKAKEHSNTMFKTCNAEKYVPSFLVIYKGFS